MSLQSIQLAGLRPPAQNPRSVVIDDDALDELAASIRSNGLPQNFVLAPLRGTTYKVISGERRLRALKLLCERGDIDDIPSRSPPQSAASSATRQAAHRHGRKRPA